MCPAENLEAKKAGPFGPAFLGAMSLPFFLRGPRSDRRRALRTFQETLQAWKAGLFYSSQQTGTFASSIPSIAKLKHRQIGTRTSWIPWFDDRAGSSVRPGKRG